MGQQTLAAESFRLPLENGLFIEGQVRVPPGVDPAPVVLLSHGFRGHKDWAFWPEVSGRLAESGFYTVSFNFSRIVAHSAAGIAEREAAEAATLSRELDDLQQVLRSLRGGRLPLAERADPVRLAILGHSRAGGGNIIFAAEHPEVQALVVWNGGSAPARTPGSGQALTFQERVLQLDQERNKGRFDLEHALSFLSAAALVIQGDQDRDSLLQQNARFREQAPQHRYYSVRGADHTFNTTDPYEGATPELNEALALTLEFLHEQLG
ncbi:alpha/beta hydrolase family protein [Paenibacillus tianjinensis]|uniref:Dienelactone hydrolase family protein n=1 Tax=Paenibacillus tianjinensis TaxID=2810347 RepID=A0ABX7LB74_9BACL|nr:dienelactone hydrolase family protein [Paenibacillus tianjinensis]QSF44521.1 dienelactone hydrolase family protein [Paenibacillus tianjinensis]